MAVSHLRFSIEICREFEMQDLLFKEVPHTKNDRNMEDNGRQNTLWRLLLNFQSPNGLPTMVAHHIPGSRKNKLQYMYNINVWTPSEFNVFSFVPMTKRHSFSLKAPKVHMSTLWQGAEGPGRLSTQTPELQGMRANHLAKGMASPWPSGQDAWLIGVLWRDHQLPQHGL